MIDSSKIPFRRSACIFIHANTAESGAYGRSPHPRSTRAGARVNTAEQGRVVTDTIDRRGNTGNLRVAGWPVGMVYRNGFLENCVYDVGGPT